MKRDVRVRLLEAEPDELRGVGDTEVARWVREDEDVRRCAATILRQTDLLNQTLASGNAEDSAIGIRVLTPFAMRERRRRARRAQSLAAVSLAAAALLTLLLTRPAPQSAGIPSPERSLTSRLNVTADRPFAVIATDNPDIAIVWLFNKED